MPWIFIAASVSFFIIQSVSLPGHTVAFHIFSKPIYAESADYALASALRIYAIVLSSMVFVRTTDPRDLAIALVTYNLLVHLAPVRARRRDGSARSGAGTP